MAEITLEELNSGLSGLDGEVPIALFPVKLQTRFATAPMVAALRHSDIPAPKPGDIPTELWVRIYPDDIFVHSHEDQLTEEEYADAGVYWNTLWENASASNRQAQRAAAWRYLSEEYGPVRSKYILAQTQPANGIDNEGFPNASAPPVLPALDQVTESWTKAARTYLLPDRFIVSFRKSGQWHQHAGNTIPKTEGALQLGIDPENEDQFADSPKGRQAPEPIRWLTDFPKAVDMGMALRIPLAGWAAGDEIEQLMVLGWRTPHEDTTVLHRLFENHRYKVGGMDLAAVGTPTNNTREQAAARPPEDLKPEESLELQQQADGSDPKLLARALGLDEATFAGLDHSQLNSIADARKVHELLFDATLGQALDFWQPDAPPPLKQDIRQHFVRWVSGRGHLPAIRIDDQPYGVLPTLPYSKLNDDAPFAPDSFLGKLWGDILRPLRTWYDNQLDNVSRIERGMAPSVAQLQLLSILQLHPTSVAYRQRFAVTPEVQDDEDIRNLFFIPDGAPKVARSGKSVAEELSERGLPNITALEGLLWDDKTYPLLIEYDSEDTPVEAADEDVLLGAEGGVIPPLPEREDNYLQWLAEADLSTLADTPPPGGQPPYAVLYHLLRHRLLMDDGADAQQLLREIQHWPAPYLRRMVQEHLDCCTYRLDAWLSSFAAQRLQEIRDQRAEGIQIGAWGYLEHLQSQTQDAESEYIPAPSIRHATAAAVLRSGFNNNRSSGTSNGLFAVDLSAGRVKNALYLLEGVRNGQDLSALLGYRLERSMQEYRDDGGIPLLAPYIQELREKYRWSVYPLVQNDQNSAPDTEEDLSQRVIDAVGLLEDRPGWEGVVTNTEAQEALRPIIEQLDDQLDSVKDLLAAEGVYQLVDGQIDRAKAALDAMTDGEQLTRPEIVDQPRSSLPLTFRMGVVLQHNALPVTGGAPLSPRAMVGAKVNRWLFDKLPDLSFIKVRVRWVSGATASGDPVYEATTLPLRHLLIEPIDLAYMMHLQRENPDTSELKYRIERVIRQQNNLPLTTRIEILERDNTGFSDRDYTLFALEPLAAGLGKLMMETRSLRPEDFLTANDESKGEAGQFWAPLFLRQQLRNVALKMEDIDEDLERALNSATNTLKKAAPPEGDANAQRQYESEIEQQLIRLQDLTFYYAGLGWVKAVPTPVERLDQLTLDQEIRRCRNILEDARSRMSEARHLWKAASTDPLSRLLRQAPEHKNVAEETALLEEITQLLFGQFYRVYPDFKMPNADAVAQALDDGQLQASMDDFAVERWIQTQAPLRPKMDLYQRGDMLTELFGGTKERQGYALLQLPLRNGQPGPWVGQEYGDFVPHGDTMAMTLELQTDFDLNDNTFSGLLIDEWQELVPEPEASTGIALQYDQPDTEAPNAILLAMTHKTGVGWDWESLSSTVTESIDLAKIRAVDPDLIKNSFLDQLLPAVLGPIQATKEDEKLHLEGLFFGPSPGEKRKVSPMPEDITDPTFDNVDLGNTVDE
ncbi:MAG: hypothetical protein GVY26_04045 [Bacteroidetes bacterium]|jgi:hypothetical protein|nr:hypothetical protein [Bacteroidota bacterium]